MRLFNSLLKNKCVHDWTVMQRTYVHSEFGLEKVIDLVKCPRCGKIKKIKSP